MATETRNPDERGFAPTATWRSYVAELPAWLIVVGALSVSFWTQVFTVNEHDLAYWESLIWAASTDLGTIACLFLAREGAYRGTATWGAWVIAVGCATMSVEFNVVRAIQVHDWLSVQIHVWMPALALGTWYWLLHGRKRQWARAPKPDPKPEPFDPLPEPRPLVPFHVELAGRMRALLAEPGGRAMSDHQLGGCLGVGADYAGRLRDEIERSPEPEPDPEPEPPAPLPPASDAGDSELALVEGNPAGASNGHVPVTLSLAQAEARKLRRKGRLNGTTLGAALRVSAVSGRKWLKKVNAAEANARPFRVEGVAA